MFRLILQLSAFFLVTVAFSGGMKVYKWRCHLDVKETRNMRDGLPFTARGHNKEEAIERCFQECEWFHEGSDYEEICQDYRELENPPIACEKSTRIGVDI